LLALGGLLPLLRRRRKAAAQVAMVAAAGVLAAPAAMAADDRWDWDYDGLYLGAGVIGTSLETSDSFNSSLAAELDLFGIESSGNFEDFPYGGQLYVGWMFNNNFGLEGRWSDSGDGESDILLEDSNGDRTNIGDIEASIDGWTVYGVANWPVAQRWDLFGKVGYTDQSADVDLSVSDGGEGGSASVSDDDSGFAAALGARWRFARHWAATVEGEYLAVDFDDSLEEPWRVGLNVEYWFGGAELPMAAAAPVAAAVAAPPPPPARPAAPKDGDGDGIVDGTDQCPDTPQGDRVGPQGCSCDVTRQLQFKLNSAELTDEDKAILDEVVENLTRLKFVSGTVTGHTDSSGSEAYNQGLSERRAQTVATYLEGKGIGAGRLKVSGAGESEPIADNTTKDGRAQNRRVVLKRTDCDAPN
jgi:OOP family OmpA-OmpF porin